MDRETIVLMLRNFSKVSKHKSVMLPGELVDIIEKRREEKSFKNIDVSKVFEYLASMMEV